MRTLIVIALFLLVSFTTSYPLKPLDERSTELTWQAWLLVDDQNQTKQSNEQMKKKVIAKSVFIVPTFSPEKCGEGTVPSKSSGRCVQVIQVDPDMQLEFLFSKLQSHLENSRKTSSGPEKFTIEIPQNDGSNDDSSASFILSPNSKSKDEKNANNNMAAGTTTSTPETSITEATTTEQVVSTLLNFNGEDVDYTTDVTTEVTTAVITDVTTEVTTAVITAVITDVTTDVNTDVTANVTTDITESISGEETTVTTAETTAIPITEEYRQAIFFRLPTTQESE